MAFKPAVINGRTVGEEIDPEQYGEDHTWVDVDRAIAAIREDAALIVGSLAVPTVKVCSHVGRCAIGAMLFAVGVTNKRLKEMGGSPHDTEVELLRARYGITFTDLDAIMGSNDHYECDDEDDHLGLEHATARADFVVSFIREQFAGRDIRVTA